MTKKRMTTSPPLEERRKDGSLVWRRRTAEQRPAAHEKHIAALLAALANLEKDTRPRAGAKSEKGKDGKAFQAMQLAGQLVGAVAGWAIDHQIGLALAGLEFVPFAGSDVKAMPEYQEALTAVDSHNLEREGGAVISGIASERLKPRTMRKVVSAAMLANLAGLPSKISNDMRDGLEGLEWGEVRPIVQPVTTQAHHVRRTGLQCQLTALCYIEFEAAAKRQKKKDAISKVAVAFGMGEDGDGVRNWPKRIRTELGQVEVARQLEYARRAGDRARRMGAPHDDMGRYSEAQMKQAGAIYSKG